MSDGDTVSLANKLKSLPAAELERPELSGALSKALEKLSEEDHTRVVVESFKDRRHLIGDVAVDVLGAKEPLAALSAARQALIEWAGAHKHRKLLSLEIEDITRRYVAEASSDP